MTPEDLLQGNIRLASLPSIVSELNEMIATRSAREIGVLVSKDAGLTARLLRIANSGFYGSHAPIDNLQQAITLLGTNQLINLVMATLAVNQFAAIPQDLVDMETFSQRSAYMCVAADTLGGLAHSQERGWLFVAGLLHGIGSLIFYSKERQASKDILDAAQGALPTIAELEEQRFGFNFADLGAALARKWRLPDTVERLIRLQLLPIHAEAHDGDSRLMRLARLLMIAAVEERAVEDTLTAIEDESRGACPLTGDSVQHAMETIPERASMIFGAFFS